MFSNLLSSLQLSDPADAEPPQGTGHAESKGASSSAASAGSVSLWNVAAAVADSVRATADDFVKTVQHTDWQSELKAIGKEVAHDTASIANNAVQLVDKLQLDDESDKVYMGEEQQHVSTPVESAAVAAQLEQVGSVLAKFGRTLVHGTKELVVQVRDAVETEIVGVPLNEQRPVRGRGVAASSHLNASTGKYNRFEAEVSAMQRDSSTYCDEPEDKEEFAAWRQTFKLSAVKPQIDKIVKQNTFMAELQARIVPLIVEYEDFWTRYFYRLHKLQQREAQRQELHSRMIKAEEDLEVGWDDDDSTNTRSGASSDKAATRAGSGAGGAVAQAASRGDSQAGTPPAGAQGNSKGKVAAAVAAYTAAAASPAAVAAVDAASSSTPQSATATAAPLAPEVEVAAAPAPALVAGAATLASGAATLAAGAATLAAGTATPAPVLVADAATPAAEAATPVPAHIAEPDTSSESNSQADAETPLEAADAAVPAVTAGSEAGGAAAPASGDAPAATDSEEPQPQVEHQQEAAAEAAPVQPASVTEPTRREPALTEPINTEPAPMEPLLTEPAPTEPTLAEPALTEPTNVEPAPGPALEEALPEQALQQAPPVLSEAAEPAAAVQDKDQPAAAAEGAANMPAPAAESAEATPDNQSDITSPEWCVVSNASASDAGGAGDTRGGDRTPPDAVALSEEHGDEEDEEGLGHAEHAANAAGDDDEEVDEDWGSWD